MSRKIILASNSPRRRDLLTQIGLTFTQDPADVDERTLPGENAGDYARRVALDKARVAAGRAGHAIVIAADTIVVLDDTILGKPQDSGDAERMLTELSGKMHLVMTGLTVMDAAAGKAQTRLATTKVWFRRLSKDMIIRYVKTGEPLDKAGAYGIQEKGALLVERIDGCYFNVVGLPISLLAEMLLEYGVKLP